MCFQRIRQRRSRSQAAKKLAAAAAGEPTELREFVYMNDVSLYSLQTSLVGPLADSFTDAQSKSLTSTIEASAEAGNDLLAKGAIRSSLAANRSASTQVLRRATVQSTFRSFLGTARHLIVPTRAPSTKAPAPHSSTGMTLEMSAFSRGQLLELDVNLRSQWLFEVITVMDAMGELSQLGGASLAGLASSAQLKAMKELLVGLIPIEATVVGWSAVTATDGSTRMVSENELSTVLPDERASARPIKLVGAASESLFWRDIRTVLFSNHQYRVLARVDRDGVHDGWNPLKLLDVLGSLDPSGSANLLTAALMDLPRAPQTAPQPEVVGEEARRFVALVTSFHGWEAVDPSDAIELLENFDLNDFEERRLGFDKVAHLVAAGRALDRNLVFRARTESANGPNTPEAHPLQEQVAAAHIEVEFIAMYW
jgi:hypothetical protein